MNKQQQMDYQRTLLLELEEGEPKPLKPAVAKAMEAAGIEEARLASRVNRKMVTAGYYTNERHGKSYFSTLTPAGVEYLQELIEYQVNPPAPKIKPESEPAVSVELLDIPMSGIHLNRRLDKTTWSRVMRMVNKHKFQTAFIPEGVEVFIRNPETDEMTKVETIA